MPGPPLRGILSPSDTSMTKIVASASSGEKVAERLSPPDSTNMIWMSGCASTMASTASRFMLASSRMAVWGQPPVSTPTMRSAGSTELAVRNSASSLV